MTDTIEETQHPDWFLRCEKMIDGNWVTTGWAPHVEAAERHADAVGGQVRVTDNDSAEVASFSEVCYNVT